MSAPLGFIATVRTQMSRFLIWSHNVRYEIDKSPKSPNSANRFGKLILIKKCQTWTALPDTESPPKYFILGNLGNPDSVPKGHVSVITKVASARELGYDWGRSLREHPRSPGHRPASTNHDINFWKHCEFLLRFISLGYYVMRTAYKYRLDRLNWNKTFHVCFWKMVCYSQVGLKCRFCHPQVGLEKMVLPLSSGLKTHSQWFVPIWVTQPSPTGIQAGISYKYIASW